MKKTDWQYFVDTLLFLCIVGIAFIGLLLGLVIPKGPLAPESAKYFLGLHRHQWGNIHFYLSIAFTVFVIIHLILSWKWIKGKARQVFKKGWGTALILTVLASFFILFLFWALFPKIPGDYEDYGKGAGKKATQQQLLKKGYPIHEEKIFYEDGTMSIVITGQTTLQEIETATGIPARKIADKLALPSNVPLDETLGKLRKRYVFTIQDVRDAVASLMKK